MNLFLISQSVNKDYDAYDSAVVVAEDEWKAAVIHPGGLCATSGWVGSPSDVKVDYLGKASFVAIKLAKHGVICASFNAG